MLHPFTPFRSMAHSYQHIQQASPSVLTL